MEKIMTQIDLENQLRNLNNEYNKKLISNQEARTEVINDYYENKKLSLLVKTNEIRKNRGMIEAIQKEIDELEKQEIKGFVTEQEKIVDLKQRIRQIKERNVQAEENCHIEYDKAHQKKVVLLTKLESERRKLKEIYYEKKLELYRQYADSKKNGGCANEQI